MQTLGDFEILEEIGKGGYGTVYKAKKEDKVFAIKAIKDTEEKEIFETIFKEYDFLKRINHPNIIKVYEKGHKDNFYYFSMDFLSGDDLKAFDEKIEPLLAARYVLQVAKALEAIDYACLVHRDIKPENMFLSEGKITLIDFGLVYDPLEIPKEKPNDMFGTPHYMAPEYLFGDNDLINKYDIYSLGVSFYYLISQEYPFEAEVKHKKGDNTSRVTQEIFQKHMIAKVPRIEEAPDWINRLIQSMMNKKPYSRPSPESVIKNIERNL